MKVVIQRSLNSKVLVKNEIVGEIQKGLVLLVCFEKDDTEECINKACSKILKLRTFPDENGKIKLQKKKKNWYKSIRQMATTKFNY